MKIISAAWTRQIRCDAVVARWFCPIISWRALLARHLRPCSTGGSAEGCKAVSEFFLHELL